jgi:hypothetical protein
MSENGSSDPFSPRAALALVVFGVLVFVALLYMIGSGMTGGSTNDGGGHAGGKGLNGYAALAGFLERRGYAVRRVRDPGALRDPGLLVLTPPVSANGAELDRIVRKRRSVGPTLVVTPKWAAVPLPSSVPGSKRGWVALAGTVSPEWNGFLDDVRVKIGPAGNGKVASWYGAGITGKLPVADKVQSGQGARLVPLVVGREDGRVLAAYVADGGTYPALDSIALQRPARSETEDVDDYPIILVFEPDLINNYGMANEASAQLADRLVRAALVSSDRAVNFDLTLNGFTRTPNLLTLAFTPPFLAATLCLLLAALAVGWRAFLRFGPPRVTGRAIAFGKRTLVANAASLIRRSRRLHLITVPYATRARERLARALALPRLADSDATETAIDRALGARTPDAVPFSITAARLRAAHTPHDIVKAAQDLHALERTLIR